MTLFRIFLEKVSEIIYLSDREILNHISARRLSIDDEVIVCDREGHSYKYRVREKGYNSVVLEMIGPVEFLPPVRKVVYAQSLLKPRKLEPIISYGTQLGVESFVLFVSRRSSFREIDAVRERTGRLKKLAASSAEISMNRIPEIYVIPDLISVLEKFSIYKPVLLYENAQERLNLDWLKKNNLENLLVIVGPEGGFEGEEVETVRESGGSILSLGDRIVTSEVAGFVALSLIQFGV